MRRIAKGRRRIFSIRNGRSKVSTQRRGRRRQGRSMELKIRLRGKE